MWKQLFDFFTKLVTLTERTDKLEEIENQLLKSARQLPPRSDDRKDEENG